MVGELCEDSGFDDERLTYKFNPHLPKDLNMSGVACTGCTYETPALFPEFVPWSLPVFFGDKVEKVIVSEGIADRIVMTMSEHVSSANMELITATGLLR